MAPLTAEPASLHDDEQTSNDSATRSSGNDAAPQAKRTATVSLEEGRNRVDGADEKRDAPASQIRRTMQPGESSGGLGGNGPPRRMTAASDQHRAPLRTFTSLFTPDKPLAPAPSHIQSIRNVIFYSPLNVLVLAIPVSWALHFALDQSKPSSNLATFVVSFIAIMPLAALLSYGTEEISLRVGQTLGGLLNATLGNAVELIVAIIALFQCELIITQTSLIGSILSNVLLVLGMSFFVGGLRYSEQEFLMTAANLNVGALSMSVATILIPAAFHATSGALADEIERADILKSASAFLTRLQVSRGASVILLLIYAGYLVFQLNTHTHLYEDEGEEEEVTLSLPVAVGLLVLSTVLVGVTSEWLVDSIEGVSTNFNIGKTLIGLIILPVVSNAAEHATAVTASYKNKINLAMSVAVGSSIQIALFVLPLLVIIGWIAGKPMSLLFDPLVSIILFLSIILVSNALADGKSNYMEGWILMNVFVVVGVVAYFVPDNPAGALFPDEYCRTGHV